MPPAAPMSPAISARIIHAALVLGVRLFLGTAARYTAARLKPPGPGVSQDEWWRANRTLIAPFVGLLLFAVTRPSRLAEG